MSDEATELTDWLRAHLPGHTFRAVMLNRVEVLDDPDERLDFLRAAKANRERDEAFDAERAKR